MPGLLDRVIKDLIGLNGRLKQRLGVYPGVERNFRILADEYGLVESMKKMISLDGSGEPVPWYTYPAIEYLKQFDFADKAVFEYGCGASTFFWGRRAGATVSVEHDPKWANRIKPLLREHQELFCCEAAKDYVAAVRRLEWDVDVLVVDGQWRMECAREGLARLKEDGLVILDNSDWFHDVANWLRSKGLFQVDFSGFGPMTPFCWTTSLFIPYHSSLQTGFANPLPVGGFRCQGS